MYWHYQARFKRNFNLATLNWRNFLSGGNKDNIRAGCKKCGYRKSVVSSIKGQWFLCFMMLEVWGREGGEFLKSIPSCCPDICQFKLPYFHILIYLLSINSMASHICCGFWKLLSFSEKVCYCVVFRCTTFAMQLLEKHCFESMAFG